MADFKNPEDYFIIDTRTRNTSTVNARNVGREWSDMKLENNEEYAMLMGLTPQELRDSLKDTGLPPIIRGRVSNFHDISHLTEEVYQYKTDKNGRIFIPKDKADDAKRIYNLLKKIDSEVDWDIDSKNTLTPEELRSKSAPRSPVVKPKVSK